MSEANQEILYPCPFSKNFGIPRQQAWLSLKIFIVYRTIVASLFILAFYFRTSPGPIERYDEQLFQPVAWLYFLLSIAAIPAAFIQLIGYARQAQLSVFFDIVFITLIMHSSGGITSGLGILLGITIAAGGLLIGGRCAMLFAALATLAILAEQIYAIQIHAFKSEALTYSAMLGASFFSIVLLSFALTQRLEQSSYLAKLQTQTIAQLEELNRHIIQHLQSGLILVDNQGLIQLCNQSALRLLKLSGQPENLADTSAELQRTFTLWRQNPELDFAIVPWPDRGDLQIRFSSLLIENASLHLLIIEDIALYNQRLQQSKLASLGRLTASIAHEIRNPLSAIQHASQLLSENSDLPTEEQRLSEIIQNHCRRINQIVDNVLMLSRRHISQRHKVVLDKWLANYLEERQMDLGAANDFELRIVKSNLSTFIDSGHLKQILDNLCSNALRYGRPEKGKPIIELSQRIDNPCIRIVDNGPGISTADLQHLFEPFFTTSRQGTGLGLYICKELAELNQAELSYGLHIGKSCFTLTLTNADHAVIEL